MRLVTSPMFCLNKGNLHGSILAKLLRLIKELQSCAWLCPVHKATM